MNNPPIPIFSASWHSIVASLLWVFVKNDPLGVRVGRFQDTNGVQFYTSATGGSSPGADLWATSSTAPGNGCVEAFFSSTVATVLQRGTVNGDGTISYGGATYRGELFWDGAEFQLKTV